MTEDEFNIRKAAQFRQSHHMLATMLAMGWTYNMISRQTGRSHRSISLLEASPAFAELVAQKVKALERQMEKYLEEAVNDEMAYSRLMRRNMMLAEQMLADKLEAANESGELLSVRELNTVTSDRSDRTGFSKHSTQEVKIGFSGELEKAIKRSGVPQLAPPTIDGNVIDMEPRLVPGTREVRGSDTPGSFSPIVRRKFG
jgi:DNA-binding MarR family transcriptional regulator